MLCDNNKESKNPLIICIKCKLQLPHLSSRKGDNNKQQTSGQTLTLTHSQRHEQQQRMTNAYLNSLPNHNFFRCTLSAYLLAATLSLHFIRSAINVTTIIHTDFDANNCHHKKGKRMKRSGKKYEVIVRRRIVPCRRVHTDRHMHTLVGT